jgi:hypothetical protein
MDDRILFYGNNIIPNNPGQANSIFRNIHESDSLIPLDPFPCSGVSLLYGSRAIIFDESHRQGDHENDV